jgi:hypothetical protein
MPFLNRRLSRRAVLKGAGAAVALPWLEAMSPAIANGESSLPLRLICIEMVHGAAGSSALGAEHNLWSPAAAGTDFDLSPTCLAALAPFRDHLTIISNTDCANAEPYTVKEVGGDHFRSSAVFLTQAHPKMTEGADVEAGTSLDQIYARRVGGETALPSIQLSIEKVDQGGATGGYSPLYTDTISWASPTRPLPMIRDPRVAFDELFGVFGTGASPEERSARRAEDRSILDGLLDAMKRLQGKVGAGDRARVADYLETIREVERRLQAVESFNASGEPRLLPQAPRGVPDSFTEHVRMMFDLQVLALQADVTRVIAFKLGRDNSNRVYPESGFGGAFHPTSHHSGKLEKILDFAKLNAFHVGQLAYLLDRMESVRDGGSTLLHRSVVLYGSAMGDSNLHNHKRVPFLVAGHAGGAIPGGRHLVTRGGAPLANAMLGVLHALGLNDIAQFGDSDRALDLAGGDAASEL